MLDGTFHITVDKEKVVAVKVHYAGIVVAETKKVRVSAVSPCYYKGIYYDAGDSFMIPISLFCDLEFDNEGTPIIESYLKPLYYFPDEKTPGKKIICKVFKDYPNISDGKYAVRIFKSCNKFGGNHKGGDVLYINKDELRVAAYIPVDRGDLRKKNN